MESWHHRKDINLIPNVHSFSQNVICDENGMPRNRNIRKVLVLGSGAIKIGEAGESQIKYLAAISTTLVLNA